MLLRELVSLILVLVMAATAVAGFEITVQNTTDKPAWVYIVTETAVTDEIKIEPNSNRNIAVDYGQMFVCTAIGDTTHFKCTLQEITPDNLYDEDGDKMYWEISE